MEQRLPGRRSLHAESAIASSSAGPVSLCNREPHAIHATSPKAPVQAVSYIKDRTRTAGDSLAAFVPNSNSCYIYLHSTTPRAASRLSAHHNDPGTICNLQSVSEQNAGCYPLRTCRRRLWLRSEIYPRHTSQYRLDRARSGRRDRYLHICSKIVRRDCTYICTVSTPTERRQRIIGLHRLAGSWIQRLL